MLAFIGRFSRGWLVLLAVISSIAVLWVGERDSQDGATLDDLLHDQVMRYWPRAYDPALPVVVVDIDEASLQQFGQWPWSRLYLAALVERLQAAGAASIAFDMLFAEADRTSPEFLLAPEVILGNAPIVGVLDQTGAESANDLLFAQVLARGPVILGALRGWQGALPKITPIAPTAYLGPDPHAALQSTPALLQPLPVLLSGAQGFGLIGLGPEGDNITRDALVIGRVGETKMPSLAIEALRVALGAPNYMLKGSGASGEAGASGDAQAVALRVGGMIIELGPDGTVRPRLAGSQEKRQVSAAAILGLPVGHEALSQTFEGMIVIVGASAQGIGYAVSTPLDARLPGAQYQAELLEAIFANDLLSRPYWGLGAERSAGIVLAILMVLLVSRRHVYTAAFLLLITGGGMVWLSVWLNLEKGLLLGPSYPFLAAFLPFCVMALGDYAKTGAEKRAVRQQFERFVAPSVVEEIAAAPDRYLAPGGVERELTVMFCDVRGFTSLVEGMDSAQTVAFVNGFLGPVSEAVLAEGGTIDKYMGDAVMAFWNAPVDLADHQDAALAGIFAARRAIVARNQAHPDEKPVEIGFGLNAGICAVGPMGSEARLDYSCIGDPVNLASRIEGATKLYGAWALVGASVAIASKRGVFAELDRIVVKGRSQPEPVYVPLLLDGVSLAGEADEAASSNEQEISKAIENALQVYRAQDWQNARALFAKLTQMRSDAIDCALFSAFYMERIAIHESDPPPIGWQGEFIAQSK